MKALNQLLILVFISTGTYGLAQNNIGIGTTNPDDRLHIENSSGAVGVKIRSASAQTTSLKLFEGSDYGFELLYDGLADRLHLWSRKYLDNEAIRMTWKKDGTIGIGTTNPKNLLHIYDSTFAALRISTEHDGFSSLKLVEPLGLGFEYAYSASSNNLDLWSRTVGGGQIVSTWLDSGHFGIGTTNPTARLEVDHDGTGDIMRLRDLGVDVMRVMNSGDVSIDSPTFYTDASTDRVGLGTTTPSGRLHVLGPATDQTAIMIENTTSGDPLIRFRLNGLTKFALGVDRTDNTFKISETTSLASQVRLTLDEPGNLSIEGEYGYLSPQTYTHQVLPCQFEEISNVSNPFVMSALGARQLTGVGALEYHGLAPIILPQGAIIKSVAFYYHDNTSSEAITYARLAVLRTAVTGIASVTNAGEVIESTTVAFSDPEILVSSYDAMSLTIDNTQYRYILSLTFEVTGDDIGLQFYGAHVEYQLNELAGH